MKNPITFDVPGNFPLLLSPVFEQSRDNSWLLRNDTGHYRVTYSIHPLWNIRFLLWFLIFAFFWLLLVLLNKIQTYKISEKQRVQQEIKELQYQVITSRFSPHYTFNVLNSLSLHLYNREKPELYDYFHKFIRQLRYLYDDKNQITRSLKEELQFCSDYLDIQKIRFLWKFDYNINL